MVPFAKQEAKFPRDFGVDTLAGVLGVDPPSFGGRGRGRRGGVSSGGKGGAGDEEERKTVMAFLERWKPFDWTAELDGETRLLEPNIRGSLKNRTSCLVPIRLQENMVMLVRSSLRRCVSIWSVEGNMTHDSRDNLMFARSSLVICEGDLIKTTFTHDSDFNLATFIISLRLV